MKSKRYVALLATILALAVAGLAGAEPPASKHFVTHLDGGQEVPARETNATGQFVAKLNDTETGLTYRLIVANIENVVAAHIHLGAAGMNGPVVAFLFGTVPPGGGRVDGVLATGTITAANLTGPLTGQALSVLIEAMRTGGTYANVHTNDGVPPVNTGPGDFPGGEVRGQIRAAAP